MLQNIESLAVTVSGSFFVGVLIGYALKKVIKLFAVVVGLFFAGVAYLQYHQIVAINWNKLQEASQNTLSTLANSTMHIPGFNNIDHTTVLTNLGIPFFYRNKMKDKSKMVMKSPFEKGCLHLFV